MGIKEKFIKWRVRDKLQREVRNTIASEIQMLRTQYFMEPSNELGFLGSEYFDNGDNVEFRFQLRYKNGSNERVTSYFYYPKELLEPIEDLHMKLDSAIQVAISKHNVNMVPPYVAEAITKDNFYSEMSTNINNIPKIQELESKLNVRDQQIDKLMQEIQSTNVILKEQGQVFADQSNLMIDMKKQLNKIEELDTDVEQLKKNMGDIKRFSDKFEDCCIGAAQRLKDGSGRQYCDCGRTITPEVVVALQLSGMIA